MSDKWVPAWGQAHSALSFFYYPDGKNTFRLVINTAIPGKRLRVRFSNLCGKGDIVVGAVTAGRCDSEGCYTDGKWTAVCMNGSRSFVLKKGETAVSDEIDFNVCSGEYLCVSVYVESGALTSGNMLNNAKLLTAKGNRCEKIALTNEPRTRDYVRMAACKIIGMFIHRPIPLFDCIELLNDKEAKSIVVFGDSISQQGFWVNALDKRIRKSYPERYAVINKSIMGNRIIRDFSPLFICKGLFGERGVTRVKRDVCTYENVEYVIFALGINDFLQYGTIVAKKSEKPDLYEVCAAINLVANTLKSRGIKVVMLTALPFGASIDYRKEKDVLRTKCNDWIRENKELFYAVYDQDKICRNPEHTHLMKAEYVGSDNLHPNVTGGQYIADSFDISIFED